MLKPESLVSEQQIATEDTALPTAAEQDEEEVVGSRKRKAQSLGIGISEPIPPKKQQICTSIVLKREVPSADEMPLEPPRLKEAPEGAAASPAKEHR